VRKLLPALGLLSSCSFYVPDPGPTAGTLPDSLLAEEVRFRSLADAYIAWYHATSPTRATFDGVHEGDADLGRWSRQDLGARGAALRQYLRRVSAIDREALPDADSFDLLVLEGHLQASLLELERIRSWERNPNFYREIVSGGLYALSSLSFDTPARRMALAAERLRQVPQVLAWARENLSDPPRIYTEIAIEEFAGTHRFVKTALPEAFGTVKDEALRLRFEEAQKGALEAIAQFVDWMRMELLPRSQGSFALGAEAYRAKLYYEERVETPLDELLARGTALLRETQEAMKRLAGDRPVRALLRESSRDHAPAGRLLEDTRALLEDLRGWASTVVDIPSEARCRVQETPEFRRSLSFASMEIPGPFETTAREAYYSITLPDPSWTEERQEQHLSFFNRYSLPLISVHEAYPGHYTQFLAVQGCSSKVRKVFGSAAFSEGWAHYCEQLYVDLKGGPPELRLHQLALALLRICRYVAGIEMHTRGMSVEQAVELFVNEGYVERAVAEREARRGTSDPTYLVYTLGKMEILRLRQEYLSKTGRSLREFHNEFIRYGYPPIPIIRSILLGRGR
jgi:uncharacterized protein (DUF885 family)